MTILLIIWLAMGRSFEDFMTTIGPFVTIYFIILGIAVLIAVRYLGRHLAAVYRDWRRENRLKRERNQRGV